MPSFSLIKKNEMKKTYFALMILLGFCSCQKEVSNKSNTSPQVDIYVCGEEWDGTRYIASYWKNGNRVILGDGFANSIFVSGNDVYVCGNGATYWKNGNLVTLGNGVGQTNSIAVSGNDVYVAGGMGGHAVYWKNGKPTYLPENSRIGEWADIYPVDSTSSTAYSIFISGSDIYIAGGEEISRMISPYPNLSHIYGRSAVYWKNSNEIYLIKGGYGSSYADDAYSIFVEGPDVYACGALEARYWKNGNYVFLGGTAKSIFVSEGDVYVAGTQPDGEPYQTYNGTRYRIVAKYWKNGIAVNLTDGSKNAFATFIAVSGNDVYVAGYEEKTAGAFDYVAKYWKNGNPVVLSNIESYANSIFIIKK